MPSAAVTCPAQVVVRLARRLVPPPAMPWTPPPIAELVARIDTALAERRAG